MIVEYPRFIGYLNKNGHVLAYGRFLGGRGHGDNKLNAYFGCYFRTPTHDFWIQQIEDRNIISLEVELFKR